MALSLRDEPRPHLRLSWQKQFSCLEEGPFSRGIRLGYERSVAEPSTPQTAPAIPPLEVLAAELLALAARSDAAARCLAASRSRVFVDPDGQEDQLNMVGVSPSGLALIAYLSRRNPTNLSIDIGFGMGGSVGMALAAQKDLTRPFTHLSFDPCGLGQSGVVVQRYLESAFPNEFRRIWKLSQIGLAQLLEERGRGCAGYFFVDGGHTFEQVMVDFSLSDQLCCVGGHIVFDDSYFPAIEAVVEYIRANRPDYAVWEDIVPGVSVVRKISDHTPSWDSFEPFRVPDRRNWTPRVPEWNAELPPPFDR